MNNQQILKFQKECYKNSLLRIEYMGLCKQEDGSYKDGKESIEGYLMFTTPYAVYLADKQGFKKEPTLEKSINGQEIGYDLIFFDTITDYKILGQK